MAVAVIQEFPIEGDDGRPRTTTASRRRLAGRQPARGCTVHTAGFDEEAGVFRVFDVWESQEAWDAFLNDRLMPIVRPLMEQGGRQPKTRVYQLQDYMA